MNAKYLGEFEQMVLLSIVRLGNNAYGTTVRKLLADVVERDVSIGGLYTTLERLENKGFLESKKGESSAERGGRAKKYFTVTGEGKRSLRRSRDSMDVLWEGVQLNAGVSLHG